MFHTSVNKALCAAGDEPGYGQHGTGNSAIERLIRLRPAITEPGEPRAYPYQKDGAALNWTRTAAAREIWQRKRGWRRFRHGATKSRNHTPTQSTKRGAPCEKLFRTAVAFCAQLFIVRSI